MSEPIPSEDRGISPVRRASAGQAATQDDLVERVSSLVREAREAIASYTNATLTVLFLCVVLSVLFYALKVGRAAWVKPERSDKETPFQPIPDA